MPSATPLAAPSASSSGVDKLVFAISLVVEVLAGSAIFTRLGLSPDLAAAILAGLMAAAAYARVKLPIASGLIDKVAVWLCAAVVGLAAAGVFERLDLNGDGIPDLDADGIAHVLGAILAIASAVRAWRAPKIAAPLALLLISTALACAHAPGALSAARCLVNDPGLDEVTSPDYVAQVKRAKARLVAGEAEAEDLELLAEAAELTARLAACVPRDEAGSQEVAAE